MRSRISENDDSVGFNLHLRDLLKKGGDGGMVVLSSALIDQRDEDLLNQARKRKRDTEILPAQKGIVEVFLVELDLKPGFEVPGNDHRHLRIHNRAPRQATSNGLVDRFGI